MLNNIYMVLSSVTQNINDLKYKQKVGSSPSLLFFVFLIFWFFDFFLFFCLIQDNRLVLWGLVEEHLPVVWLTSGRVNLILVWCELEECIRSVQLAPFSATHFWVDVHIVEVYEAHLVFLSIFFHMNHLDVFNAVATKQFVEYVHDLFVGHEGHHMWDAKRWNRHDGWVVGIYLYKKSISIFIKSKPEMLNNIYMVMLSQ